MNEPGMIATRPIRDAEEYIRVRRQWTDETAYLRNEAIRLISTHAPTVTYLTNSDGSLAGPLEAVYPPEVAAHIAYLNRCMTDHAVKLGLTAQPVATQTEREEK